VRKLEKCQQLLRIPEPPSSKWTRYLIWESRQSMPIEDLLSGTGRSACSPYAKTV
jgi:hypothetical protein